MSRSLPGLISTAREWLSGMWNRPESRQEYPSLVSQWHSTAFLFNMLGRLGIKTYTKPISMESAHGEISGYVERMDRRSRTADGKRI